jgi:HTH-type transcriptional regulator / antitoxin HigA
MIHFYGFLPRRRNMNPSEHLQKLLDKFQWDQKDLAEAMGRPLQLVNELLSGKRRVTVETALELEAVFDGEANTKAHEWIALDAMQQIEKAKATSANSTKADVIKKRTKLKEQYPSFSEVVKRGWIEGTKDLDLLEQRVKSFFDSREKVFANFRRSNSEKYRHDNVDAWVSRVIALSKTTAVEKFISENLQTCVNELLSLTKNAEDVSKAPGVLSKYGIKFVYLPNLPKCPIDGIAFRGEDNTPVIGMSIRYGQVDRFWFVLLHEVAHIYCNHIDKNENVLLDNYEKMQNNVSEVEAEANRFASDWLIDPQEYKDFVESTFIYDSNSVSRFSASIRRSEAIIVGRLKHDALLTYNQLANVHTNIREILEPHKLS